MPITLVLLAKNGAFIRNIVVAPMHGIVPIPGDSIYTGEGTLAIPGRLRVSIIAVFESAKVSGYLPSSTAG
ncbi:MAG TPA: hypothetical protein VK638_30665 [Edaphobacter sp.]|nr:hypothetical protein [Edaphobacter sp.]